MEQKHIIASIEGSFGKITVDLCKASGRCACGIRRTAEIGMEVVEKVPENRRSRRAE